MLNGVEAIRERGRMVAEKKVASKKEMKKRSTVKRKTSSRKSKKFPSPEFALLQEFLESIEYQGKRGDWTKMPETEEDPDE